MKQKKNTKQTEQLDLTIFQTIVEQSPVTTQIFSPQRETIMVNPAWEKLCNVTFDQIHGYNILKDNQLVEKGIMKYIKKGFRGESALIPAIKYEPSKTVDIKGAVPYRWVSARIYG